MGGTLIRFHTLYIGGFRGDPEVQRNPRFCQDVKVILRADNA